MATAKSEKKARRRRPELAQRDPLAMSEAEYDAFLRDAETKIDQMEAFAASEEWNLQRTRLENRRRMLENELKGLHRRLVRPVAGQPAVTLEQIAYQQGRLDENADLLRFPKLTVAMWRAQLEELRMTRERRT